MDQANQDLRLRLVFRGESIQGHDPSAVRRAVAVALKLSERRAARLFSGKPIVMKQQVDVRYAARLVASFAAWGAVLHAQPMPAPMPAAVQPGPIVPQLAKPRTSLARPTLPWRRFVVAGLGSAVLSLVLVGAWVLGNWLGHQSVSAGRPPSANLALAPAAASVPAPTNTPTPTLGPGLAPAPAGAVAAAPVADSLDDDDLVKRLSPRAAMDYQRVYRLAKQHRAFAVSEAGAHAWVTDAATEDQARDAALQRCMQLPGASPCRLVDVDGQQLE